MEGFLRVTHALSLNDTFGVKGTESPLNWKKVSLYRNEFNEVISRAAFDGTFVSERMPSTSPEFGTDGGYAIGRIKNPNKRLLQNRSRPPLAFCLPAENRKAARYVMHKQPCRVLTKAGNKCRFIYNIVILFGAPGPKL